MGEHENSGEEITRYLLVRDSEETWSEQVKLGGYLSSVTGVLLFSTSVAVCGSLNFGLARMEDEEDRKINSFSLFDDDLKTDFTTISMGYTSPVEFQIINDLGLSTAEYSLFGSFFTIGGALGAIACGKTSDYLGRKGTFWMTDLFSIGGWFAIALSQSALSLYLGRLVLGFAVALIAYIPVYIAEITPKDLRGGFVTLHTLMMSTGICIAYILGVFISWRVLAAIGIIPNLVQIIGLFFIPESPRCLRLIRRRSLKLHCSVLGEQEQISPKRQLKSKSTLKLLSRPLK